MAEIKIEKKKPIWPWILVILVILAAIYFFWSYNDENLEYTEDLFEQDTISQVEDRYNDELIGSTPYYTGTYGTVENEQSLADYFSIVDSLDTDSVDNSLYREGFFKLIAATERRAELNSVDVSSTLSTAREHAEKLAPTPTSTAKADEAKKVATEISKALKTIQVEDYNNLTEELKEVDESVSKIEDAQTLEKEYSDIEIFFDKSARLLQKMNETNENEINQ